MKRTILWIGALVVGAFLGLLPWPWLGALTDFVATVYVRLFQLLAVPTIVLAVVSTLATMSTGAGRLFRCTLFYTLLTTVAAAAVGALLFVVVLGHGGPALTAPAEAETGAAASLTYYDHVLSVIPSNVVRPLLEGNVLSLLLMAFAVGIALARLPRTESREVLLRGLQGLQDVLFLLIGWLVWTLPLGIVAFAAQLSAQLSAGVVAGQLGRYVLVVLGAGAVQFFVVLPLLLVVRGLNPLRVLRAMGPAVLMALFTKSSAATLPVTLDCAQRRLGVRGETARFVLPVCTTINMNGCAAFILVTSLFVMQQAGMAVTLSTVLLWLVVAVVSAVGNAGVPMGCYFLTLSLMSGIGAPVALMGLILPVYTIIDMAETAENVWSDACVCALTDRTLQD